MRSALVFEFFQKYLFSDRAGALVKRISWLTIVGLGISVAALLLVISVMTALNKNIEKRTLAVEPHLTVTIPSIKSSALLELHPLTAKLKANSDLRVGVVETQDVIVRTADGHFRGGIAKGQSLQRLNQMLQEIHQLDVKNGTEPLLPMEPETLAAGEVLVGVDLAVNLGIFEGDSLMVIPPEGLLLPPTEAPRYDKVIVKKIIATNLADVDAQNIFYVRDHTLTKLKDSDSRKASIEIWTPSAGRAEIYKQEMIHFPEAQVQTWKERNSALFFALKLEKTIITLFLSLAGMIASFSMISVLVLLISQKRREIGLLQAIGFSRARVQELFMRIGLSLALCGLGFGVIVGVGVSYWIERHPLNVLPDIYYDSQIPAYVDGAFVGGVVFAGVMIAIIGSYFSSRGAARVAPSVALRSKN